MRFQRVAGIGGLVTAGLLVVAGIVGQAGGLPASDDPAPQIASHYRIHGGSTVLSAAANALAALLLIVFATGLWQRLSQRQDPAARGWALAGLIGAGATSVMVLVVSMLQLALPLAASGSGGEGAVPALSASWNAGVLVLGLALIPFLTGFGLAGLGSDQFPNILAWVGFVGAGAALLGLGQAVLPGPAAQITSLIASLQYPALFVWIAVLSVVLLRAAPQERNGVP